MAFNFNPGSYTARPLDFSSLANIPDNFWKGQQQGQNDLAKKTVAEALKRGDIPAAAAALAAANPSGGLTAAISNQKADYNQQGVYGTPIYGVDNATGEAVVGFGSRNGSGVQWSNGSGQNVTPTKGVRFLNQGTQYAGTNVLTGQPTGQNVPINNAQKAADTAVGAQTGAAQGHLGTTIDNANFGLKYLDDLITKAPDTSALGDSAVGGYWAQLQRAIPATEAKGFQNLLDQVNSGAFLQAFDTLRGGGQISNAEGEKATAAKSRMNTATNREDFISAAKDFRDVIVAGVERAKKSAQGDFSPTTSTPKGAKPVPTDPSQLVPGQRYQAPDGRTGIWDGKIFRAEQ